jgi:hypothetical protein
MRGRKNVGNRRSIVMLACCALVSLFALLYPVYVIWPFRHQGPHELLAALAITRYRLLIDVFCAAIAVLVTIHVWRTAQDRRLRITAVGLLAAVIVFGAVSRVNIYEQMFHPLERPAFQPASQAKLDGREEVIAVRIGTAARAYPVRSMSYHHIVNDVLSGVPIVATY